MFCIIRSSHAVSAVFLTHCGNSRALTNFTQTFMQNKHKCLWGIFTCLLTFISWPFLSIFQKNHDILISAGAVFKKWYLNHSNPICRTGTQHSITAISWTLLSITGIHGLYCTWTNWRIRKEINSNTAFINRVLTDQKVVHLLRMTESDGEEEEKKWSTSETDWPCAWRACTHAHTHTSIVLLPRSHAVKVNE